MEEAKECASKAKGICVEIYDGLRQNDMNHVGETIRNNSGQLTIISTGLIIGGFMAKYVGNVLKIAGCATLLSIGAAYIADNMRK